MDGGMDGGMDGQSTKRSGRRPGVDADGFPSGLVQPEGSMRFGMDALLLAAFAARSLAARPCTAKNARRDAAILPSRGLLAMADMGCGCGASAIALAKLDEGVKILGLDVFEELVESARANVRHFALEDRVRAQRLDLAEQGELEEYAGLFDAAMANPPYWEEGEGLVSRKGLNETARRGHDSLAVFLAAASRLLAHKGRLFLVYPASRLTHLLCETRRHGFGARALVFVRSRKGAAATRALVDAQLGARSDIRVLDDIVLQDEKGYPPGETLAFCPWLAKGEIPEASVSDVGGPISRARDPGVASS